MMESEHEVGGAGWPWFRVIMSSLDRECTKRSHNLRSDRQCGVLNSLVPGHDLQVGTGHRADGVGRYFPLVVVQSVLRIVVGQ